MVYFSPGKKSFLSCKAVSPGIKALETAFPIEIRSLLLLLALYKGIASLELISRGFLFLWIVRGARCPRGGCGPGLALMAPALLSLALVGYERGRGALCWLGSVAVGADLPTMRGPALFGSL